MESNTNMNLKYIFPLMKVVRQENTLVLYTVIRKRHYGKYYFQALSRNAYVPEGQMDFSAAISGFNRDIYLAQTYGKVYPKMLYKNGISVFPRDFNDVTEKDRLDPKLRK